METFISEDGLVLKALHDDGSETAIKTVSSCDTIRNPKTGVLELNNKERNKYSVFVSSSVGCIMKCNFCYLTIKNSEYKKLQGEQILDNLKEALIAQVDHNPETVNKYLKLCWMGMGENHMVNPEATVALSKNFIDWALQNRYAKGLDGIDIATVLPKLKNKTWKKYFHYLDNHLPYNINPNNNIKVHKQSILGKESYVNRSMVRLFYSLHSAVQSTRDNIIPNAMPLEEAVPLLVQYSKGNTYNLIFHHMFMEGQNDSEKELRELLKFIDKYDLYKYEFRILRYNKCENATFGESKNFDYLVQTMGLYVPNLKIQISTGNEVKAACGQFIVRNYAGNS